MRKNDYMYDICDIYKWYILHIIYTWVCVCTHIYVIFPKGIQPCNMKSWDICWRYKIQEMYIGQWRPSPLHLGTWDLTQFSQLPSVAPSYFPESHQQSEASSLSKVILVLGKARSHRALNLGCSRAGSPGWFDVSPKKLCMRHVAWVGTLSWWSCQSPVTHSCSLLSHLNNFHRGMCKLNPKSDADSLLYLLSHFECNSHTVHMLPQQYLLPPTD